MAKARTKAKNYKRGAYSASDAVVQLRAAAAKCDTKWMKAHAASARFFGARETEVKGALARCGNVKSSLMGTRKRKASKRGLKGTKAQHMEAGLEYLSLARSTLARAEAAPAYTEKRQDEALKALHYATDAVSECGWAPQEGLTCRREGRELVERATRLVKKRVESTGRDMRGLKGTSLMGAKPKPKRSSPDACTRALRERTRKAMQEHLTEARMALEESEEGYAETMLDSYRRLTRRCSPSVAQKREAEVLERKLRAFDLPARGDEGLWVHGQLDGARKRRGMRGLQGTSEEHAATAEAHFRAAREELEFIPKQGANPRLLARSLRHITSGFANCDWVRDRDANDKCETEGRRLIRELAAREGGDRVFTHGFALSGTKPRRRRRKR